MVQVRGRTAHLGLVASLLLAFAQAPFLHVHESDPAHGHAHGFTHSHFGSASDGGPELRSGEDLSEARSLSWLAGDGKPPVRLVAAMPELVSIPELVALPGPMVELAPRSHDPPWRAARQSRAPPA
jgi:hypothetical protein